MDDLAGGAVPCAIRHAPTHQLGGTGYDLGTAFVQLEAESFIEGVVFVLTPLP
jgi:hypothetical protein